MNSPKLPSFPNPLNSQNPPSVMKVFCWCSLPQKSCGFISIEVPQKKNNNGSINMLSTSHNQSYRSTYSIYKIWYLSISWSDKPKICRTSIFHTRQNYFSWIMGTILIPAIYMFVKLKYQTWIINFETPFL